MTRPTAVRARRSPATDDEAYPDDLSLREARDRFFRASGLGPGGDYSARWVRVELKPFPVYFPNTAARVRAVKLHDLHHVLTGYDTTVTGEAEIGAWELASGCAHHSPAWVLNSGSFTLGLFLAPRRLFRAFVRGRHSRNLYRGEFHEPLLEENVGEMRRELELDRGAPAARPADLALFAAAAAGAVAAVGASALLWATALRRGVRLLRSRRSLRSRAG